MVNYTGRLEDGTIFDTSIDKEALKINIGVGQVIKGWDLGIMSMKMNTIILNENSRSRASSPVSIRHVNLKHVKR